MPKLPTEYYVYPQEVWDEKECEKAAKQTTTEGLGLRLPFPGYVGSSCYPPYMGGYGRFRFNGGCIRAGKWYAGEERLPPKVAAGYKIVHVSSWGYRIVREEPV